MKTANACRNMTKWFMGALLALPMAIASVASHAGDTSVATTQLLNLLNGPNVDAVLVIVKDGAGPNGESWFEFKPKKRNNGMTIWNKKKLTPDAPGPQSKAPDATMSSDTMMTSSVGITMAPPANIVAQGACGAFPCVPGYKLVCYGGYCVCRPC
ncbi:MAG: hypothetical protein KIT00_02350 [Rhodospirillales bacterium]|nr:hypothetical protein [Rhodospirillales bacterium]